MKTFKKILIVLSLMLTFLPHTISSGYAFFDNRNISSNNSSIQIGDWATQVTVTKLIDFETFTNTNTGTITATINTVNFSLTSVTAGTTTNDQKNGTTSAKITQIGNISTTDYFTNLQTISFYLGMANNSKLNGSYSFNVEISNNGSSWTSISTTNSPANNLTLYSFDMATLLANGITLSNGTATSSTPLVIRIVTYATGSTKYFNVDDLTIAYLS